MIETLHRIHARVLTAGQDRVAAARGRGEEGQGTLEYIGVAVIVGVIIVAVAGSGVEDTLTEALQTAVETVTGAGG